MIDLLATRPSDVEIVNVAESDSEYNRSQHHDTCLIRHVHVAQYVAFAHNSAEHR